MIISFALIILMSWCFFYQNLEQLQVTQNLLAFFIKCKQTFRVIDDTSEFTNCQIKEVEEAIFIQDYIWYFNFSLTKNTLQT